MSKFSAVVDKQSKLPADSESTSVAASPVKTGRPPGKKGSADHVQVTVYLRKQVHTAARKMLFDERRQFSDLVDELVSKWILDFQKSGSPNA